MSINKEAGSFVRGYLWTLSLVAPYGVVYFSV